MYSCNMKDRQKKGQRKRRIKLDEGGVRVGGDVVLLVFWCGFAEIFVLICGIADSFTKPSSLRFFYVILCSV